MKNPATIQANGVQGNEIKVDQTINISSPDVNNKNEEQNKQKDQEPGLAAPNYRRKGLVPIFLDGKKPIEKGWQNFTPENQTQELIEEKAKKFKRKNVGLLCYEDQVLDFDDNKTYEEWIDKFPSLKNTVTTATGRGKHVRIKLKNAAQQLTQNIYFEGKPVELKGKSLTGGCAQIVVPPSIHPVTKGEYTFLPGKSFDEIDVIEVECLEDIGFTTNKESQNFIEGSEGSSEDCGEDFEEQKPANAFLWWKRSGERLVTKTIQELRDAEIGRRNSVLSKWAGRMFQKLDEDYWEDVVPIISEEAIKVGLEPAEIEATLKSAQEYALRKRKDRQEKEVYDDKNKTAVVITILKDHWNFQRNVVTGKIEFKKSNADNFKNFEDVNLNSILTFIRKDKNISLSKTLLREIIESEFSPEFHPFKEAINNLPEWDGVTDHIQRLAETIKVNANNIETWHLYFKRWLIGLTGTMIGEAINPSCLILRSDQGDGKTKWLNSLTLHGLEEYSYCGYLNYHDKDAMIKASEKYIINLDELEGSLKQDWSFLKSLITMDKISVRRPYGYFDQELRRYASFCGSIDKETFLDDAAGTRRWLVVETVSINYILDPEFVKNAYSQAYALFRRGEKYWFDRGEIQQINRMNEQFNMVCAEEEQLLKYYEPISADELDIIKLDYDLRKDSMKMNTEIFNVLQSEYTGKLSERKLGMMLKKHGFIREKFERIYQYAVRRK